MHRALEFIVGLLFGWGLLLSGMTDPGKVQGFLDLFGPWDPSLAFVMGGAVTVSAAGYALARRCGHPLFAPRFALPTRRDLDLRLIAGAALFGVGWGLAGLCPGPALVAMMFGPWEIIVFVGAMAAGMASYHALPTDWPAVAFRREAPGTDG